MNVGDLVKYKDAVDLPRESVMVGKIIGVRMLNADDTRDLLCTVKWRFHDRTCDVWDHDLEVVEKNIDNPDQTS
tara:strand:- start:73 stop:294 length:222 start_codon:yes stop_codon:yes gene_type:complete